MITRIIQHFIDGRNRQRIAIALARGGAAVQSRRIDPTRPLTWEFGGFSQNGEDGVIDVLRSRLIRSDRNFLEIGAADGIENNTAWLAIVHKHRGLMVEGDPRKCVDAERGVGALNIGLQVRQLFVTRENIGMLDTGYVSRTPDVLSLDIDGMDYHVAEALFGRGFRPRIAVVEYNSVFGPDDAVTIPYAAGFRCGEAHASGLYHGASIGAWIRFFSAHGYRFVTVESNGVNAFFVDPAHFDAAFLDAVQGSRFNENVHQLRRFGMPWEGRRRLIGGLPTIVPAPGDRG